MDYATYCEELTREGGRFVERARHAEITDQITAPVASCPGWRVSDLMTHLGTVHRWAEHLVRVRAPARISTRDMGLSRGPVDPRWLAEGLDQLVTTLRASDPDAEMWSWGVDQHVRFWARRQLHETLVHRLDLEGAMGLPSEIDPEVGVDAIGEFLSNLPAAASFSPDVRNLVGAGEVLAFVTSEGRRWRRRLDPGGFVEVREDDEVPAAATLRATTAELLMVVTRRRALEDSTCEVGGRRDLIEHWLANSALQ